MGVTFCTTSYRGLNDWTVKQLGQFLAPNVDDFMILDLIHKELLAPTTMDVLEQLFVPCRYAIE